MKTKDEKVVGKEDTDVVVEEHDTAQPADQKQGKIAKIASFEWSQVSHVLMGPKGISLIPVGTVAKYPSPQTVRATPAPGQSANEEMLFDLDEFMGAMEAVSELEESLAMVKKDLEAKVAELKTIKSNFDKLSTEFDTFKKAQTEETPKEEVKPEEEKKPEEMAKPEPKVDPAVEEKKDENKEEEKKEGELAEKAEKKEEEHSADGIPTLVKALQIAKKQGRI